LVRKRLVPDLWIAAALFVGDFTDQPWNNGYGYMAIARMFRDRPWTGRGSLPLPDSYQLQASAPEISVEVNGCRGNAFVVAVR
jgi:hypothetical protein